MSTGYTTERAAPHELAVSLVFGELNARGFHVEELPVDGHRPDGRLVDTGDYVEIKTGNPNLTVELNSLMEYRRIENDENRRVFIVWVEQPQIQKSWNVHTPDSLTAGIQGGPHRHSGTGSNDDWYKCVKRGSSFDEFFPS